VALSLVESLYQGLHDANICVDDVPLRDVVAMSMPDGWTAIDTARIETRAEEAVALAHEFGHHKTDSFYNNYSGFDVRAKHEYAADKWAVQHLLAPDRLQTAISNAYISLHDLAEYFDVTPAFVSRAFDIYNRMGIRFDFPDLYPA